MVSAGLVSSIFFGVVRSGCGVSILNLFRDRHAVLQKLCTGYYEMVTGLQAVQNNIIIADGVADGQAFLTRESTSTLFHGHEHKETPVDSSYRQNWNDGPLVIAPDNLGAHLLGDAPLSFWIFNGGFGQDRLRIVINLGRNEGDARVADGLTGFVQQVNWQANVKIFAALCRDVNVGLESAGFVHGGQQSSDGDTVAFTHGNITD